VAPTPQRLGARETLQMLKSARSLSRRNNALLAFNDGGQNSSRVQLITTALCGAAIISAQKFSFVPHTADEMRCWKIRNATETRGLVISSARRRLFIASPN